MSTLTPLDVYERVWLYCKWHMNRAWFVKNDAGKWICECHGRERKT